MLTTTQNVEESHIKMFVSLHRDDTFFEQLFQYKRQIFARIFLFMIVPP